VYGFFFALTAPYLIMQFLAPIALLALLVIWALPNQRSAPTYGVEILFAAYFISLILWPDYLALHFPGMPWITSLRVTAFPMLGVFLICLSVSKEFRTAVAKSVMAIKPLWYFICGLLVVQVYTVAFSPTPVSSVQIVILFVVLNFSIFVVSATLFRRIDYIERYWALLCCLALPLSALVILEARQQHLLWMTNIPSFLRVPDETVTKILIPEFRPGINLYRAKGTFRTSLVLAEYLSLLTPFLLHFGFSQRRLVVRVAALSMIPLLFLVIRLTDSRLGLVGMLISILLFGCFWSFIRWRRQPRNLLSAAILFAYPATFCIAVGLILASTRLSIMVFGGGAQAGSTAARSTQLAMALQALVKRPLGYGPGQSGEAMGFSEGQFRTVDNFFITVSLDLGVPGIVFWYGAFIVGILSALRYCLSREFSMRREATLLGPLAIALSAFLVVKWVHGQADLHSIPFMELGMISALVYRLRKQERMEREQAAPISPSRTF
ncbi:MAG: O-antigen ligase family protein, partial [Bacteroidales bacterium]